MKKLLRFALILAMAAVAACEGPEGPPGPEGTPGAQGPQGPQGPAGPAATGQSGQVYNIPGWDFTEENDYHLELDLERVGIEVLDSDILLVFLLFDAYEGRDGNLLPIWKPLPVTLLVEDQGILQYDFSYSPEFLAIYMNSQQVDLAEIADIWKLEQVFKVVVVPGNLVTGRSSGPPLEQLSYEEVVKRFKINEENIQTLHYKNN